MYVFLGPWIPAMKTAMTLVTPINTSRTRQPHTNLTDEQTENMRKGLKALSLI